MHCHSAGEVMATVKKYKHYGVLIAELNLPDCKDSRTGPAAGPDPVTGLGIGIGSKPKSDTAATFRLNRQSAGAAEQEPLQILSCLYERGTAYPVILRRRK